MKHLFTTIVLLIMGSSAQIEATISIVRVHPDSRELVKESGGAVPDEMAEEYRILFLCNSKHGNNKEAQENGYLASRVPVICQADMTGMREFQTPFGSIGVVVSLTGEAMKKLAESYSESEHQSLGLLIDENWLFLITGPENIRFEDKEIWFGTINRLDQRRAILLFEGKRGKDDPILKIAPDAQDYPTAEPIPGREGFYKSPYTGKMINAQHLPSGILLNDPDFPETEGKFFFLPD